jgi:mannose-6-phosphate isomerase-like protein (cupin superfamily)
MNAALSPVAAAAPEVKPGTLFSATDAPAVTFTQNFVPAEAGLDFLSAGTFTLAPDARSRSFACPGEEALLFQWHGRSSVDLDGATFDLSPYDVLYVPRGAAFSLRNADGERTSRVIQCSAPADNVHPVFHARFAELSKREDRIRHLKGKDVFMMFDVGEPGDKLVAGYTFFEPNTRSWPPHNHTDQEEVYIFIKGEGGMQVYETDEKLTFVKSVKEGDMVTIPVLNYHPVFSQDTPLQFIWCIAGARYWVGDKNKDFMKGDGKAITT